MKDDGMYVWRRRAVILLAFFVAGCASGPKIEPRIVGLSASPDGSQVAFAVIQQKPYVCILDFQDGIAETVPVPGFVEAFYGLSWDPDGKFLVTTVIEGGLGNPGPFSIWKLTLAGKKWKKIAELKEDICQRALVSQKGNVVFRAAVAMDLFLVGPEGEGKRQLTDSGDTFRLGYAWNPDGSKIYFSRGYRGDTLGIWLMNQDGTEKRSVLSKVYARILAVSHTGNYLAYSVPGGKEAGYRNALFVAASDGSNTQEVSPDSGPWFSWHPTEDILAYACDGALMIWDASRGNPVLTSLEGINVASNPTWLAEGRVICFVREMKEVWSYDLSSKTIRKKFDIGEKVPTTE